MKLVTANPKLRADIRTVQSQLKSAIQNHQMILFKLKDQPVSIKLRLQMTSVQRHIISLGEKQKKLLMELRQEVEATGAMKIDQKPSLKALQMNVQMALTKSANSKKEQAIKMECPESYESTPEPVKPAVVQNSSRRKSKLVPNVDEPVIYDHCSTPSSSPSQKENTPSSTPCSSPTHGANSNKPTTERTAKSESLPTSSASEESQDAYIQLPADPEERKKLQFMTALSLVTREVLSDLQNRRTERKRRSTTNPQFYYGNSADTKRKKPLYLTNSSTSVTVRTSNVETSLVKDKAEISESLACFSCSEPNGTLNRCSACLKSFHWNCVFDSNTPSPSADAVRCLVCQDEDIPKN